MCRGIRGCSRDLDATALQSAAAVATRRFRGARARALFAGLAAHSALRLDARPSAAVGLLLGTLAHAVGWPFVRGGASRLADALAAELTSLGGTIVTEHAVSSIDALPPARSILCDVTPKQLVSIAGARLSVELSHRAREIPVWPRRLQARLGALRPDSLARRAPVAWPARCTSAARWMKSRRPKRRRGKGRLTDRPFVLLTQSTVADRGRAPAGRHVAWGYCHVPPGSTVDMTERIERQVERFAPGFRDTIVARHAAAPHDLERANPNLVGGDIGGGALDLGQLFTRPTWRRLSNVVARFVSVFVVHAAGRRCSRHVRLLRSAGGTAITIGLGRTAKAQAA